MVLGTTLKSAISCGLYPLPREPYKKHSFDHVDLVIRALDIHTACDKIWDVRCNYPYSTSGIGTDAYNLKATLGQSLDLVKKQLGGLNLNDFKKLGREGKTTN